MSDWTKAEEEEIEQAAQDIFNRIKAKTKEHEEKTSQEYNIGKDTFKSTDKVYFVTD